MGDDNIVYVAFSKKNRFDEFIDGKLDEGEITDADLRQSVVARAETWRSWLTARVTMKAENISLDLTALPEDVREAARPEIQQWMVEQCSAWFKKAGMEVVGEVLVLAIGQASLEQRARDQGMTLV